MKVSRTAYYRYVRGNTYNADKKYLRAKHEIRKEFLVNKKRYGSRRIKVAISENGIDISRKTVAKLMKEEGLKALQPKSFIPKTTDSKHGKRVAENLLLNKPKPDAPDQIWVSDITYIAIKSVKWAYLATYMDLYTRKIVGWKVDDNMRESLVREPLETALIKRKIKVGSALIIHSDRGSQYLSDNMSKLINKTFKISQSMSRKSECYDNANAESLWSRLKTELEIPKYGYENIQELRTVLFEYIEAYYNPKRLHSSIDYKSPNKFEMLYYKNQVKQATKV
jgi:putative transposase